MTLESIRKSLAGAPEPTPAFHEFAVLIPLFEHHGELCILFEVRSRTLNSQPGEICLPGGRLEHNEAPEATAVRETCEELGICSERIVLLGSARPLITPFRYALHPFVGFLKDFTFPDDLIINPDEVETVFSVPLSWFLANEPDEYCIQSHFDFPEDFPYHLIQNGRGYAWKTAAYPVHFYRYGETVIWGMTAKIIKDFCEMICPKT